jgi:hypothetical protein
MPTVSRRRRDPSPWFGSSDDPAEKVFLPPDVAKIAEERGYAEV